MACVHFYVPKRFESNNKTQNVISLSAFEPKKEEISSRSISFRNFVWLNLLRNSLIVLTDILRHATSTKIAFNFESIIASACEEYFLALTRSQIIIEQEIGQRIETETIFCD